MQQKGSNSITWSAATSNVSGVTTYKVSSAPYLVGVSISVLSFL